MNLYNFDNEIQDTQIRIIGSDDHDSENNGPLDDKEPQEPKKQHHIKWIAIAISSLAVIAVVGVLVLLATKSNSPQVSQKATAPAVEPATVDTTFTATVVEEEESTRFVTVCDTTVNDIPLRVITPHGSQPEIITGKLPVDDPTIMLAAMAADVRADNQEIAGAFICSGKLVAKGHPKKGFCAIIGNEVTIGMSSETPLFEKALNENGHFFRQFSVVHESQIGEKTPKGKAPRRVLCVYHDELCIIETVGRESFHDFSEALIDMGISEAISLVGAPEIAILRAQSGETQLHPDANDSYAGANYIVWR